jgi:creatinine amidohydrolase/Fe(II)-dependent formamide hydrolase-like protein
MVRVDDWAGVRTLAFAGLDPETTEAVLPLHAPEAYGPHLPVGTDSLSNSGIVAAAHRCDEMPARLEGEVAAMPLEAMRQATSGLG